MMRHWKAQGIVGTSAKTPDNNPDTDMRALKFEGNRRRRFWRCPLTQDGYKCWIIGDFSGSDIWGQISSAGFCRSIPMWWRLLPQKAMWTFDWDRCENIVRCVGLSRHSRWDWVWFALICWNHTEDLRKTVGKAEQSQAIREGGESLNFETSKIGIWDGYRLSWHAVQKFERCIECLCSTKK
jgi:hypothetical protein